MVAVRQPTCSPQRTIATQLAVQNLKSSNLGKMFALYLSSRAHVLPLGSDTLSSRKRTGANYFISEVAREIRITSERLMSVTRLAAVTNPVQHLSAQKWAVQSQTNDSSKEAAGQNTEGKRVVQQDLSVPRRNQSKEFAVTAMSPTS